MKKIDIPLLTASDIDCRVQSVSKSKSGKVGATVLLYKDARVDMRMLDQIFGPFGWQRSHELINGNLFCNIDIWDEDNHEWIRKQDVGVESNTEKEKGQASDAFKRAGFNVGIGRELYTAPFVYIELSDDEWYEDAKTGKAKCSASARFSVSEISYNDRRDISSLEIVDRRGVVRFKFPAGSKPASRPAKHICSDCGKKLESAKKRDGTVWSPDDIASYSTQRFERVLCHKCIAAAMKAEDSNGSQT